MNRDYYQPILIKNSAKKRLPQHLHLEASNSKQMHERGSSKTKGSKKDPPRQPK